MGAPGPHERPPYVTHILRAGQSGGRSSSPVASSSARCSLSLLAGRSAPENMSLEQRLPSEREDSSSSMA
jgi:hypothetical protein